MQAPAHPPLIERLTTRDRLLEAAFQVFASRGYAGATIDAIAQAAGYSKGGFYFHFAAKEAIFLEILWSRVQAEEATLRSAGISTSDGPLTLLRGVAAYLGSWVDDPLWPALLVEFWAQGVRNARVRDGLAAVARFRRDTLVVALRAATTAGIIRPLLPISHCADLLLTIGDGLMAHAGADQGSASVAYLPTFIADVLGITVRARSI